MVRKLIGFDPETQQALDLLSRDSGKSLQQLADEAFADLLAKHNRPRTLKDALKQSAKRGPAMRTSLKADAAPDSRVLPSDLPHERNSTSARYTLWITSSASCCNA
jgi:hypothetical protein